MTAPRALPRRANTIRALSASMAARKLTEVAARQAVSDRIGYGVAAILGAVAFHSFGENGVFGMCVLYVISAMRAYRKWRVLKDAE